MKRDYGQTIQQIKGVVSGETDLIANLSNIAAVLKELDGYFWVGFYLVKENEMVVGPFQGPVACTRIAKGKGVCGTAWSKKQSIIVDNVHEHPGHIACSPLSQSEIVVPVFDKHGEVVMVLDADSTETGGFSHKDRSALEAVGEIITKILGA